jgi:hypothetical protein
MVKLGLLSASSGGADWATEHPEILQGSGAGTPAEAGALAGQPATQSHQLPVDKMLSPERRRIKLCRAVLKKNVFFVVVNFLSSRYLSIRLSSHRSVIHTAVMLVMIFLLIVFLSKMKNVIHLEKFICFFTYCRDCRNNNAQSKAWVWSQR